MPAIGFMGTLVQAIIADASINETKLLVTPARVLMGSGRLWYFRYHQ